VSSLPHKIFSPASPHKPKILPHVNIRTLTALELVIIIFFTYIDCTDEFHPQVYILHNTNLLLVGLLFRFVVNQIGYKAKVWNFLAEPYHVVNFILGEKKESVNRKTGSKRSMFEPQRDFRE